MNRKYLLIIDDSLTYRSTLRFLFQADYTVKEAANGEEGFRLAVETRPDIILCDVVMPLKDGYSCCHLLKTHPGTYCIPIIMLTSKNEIKDMMAGLKLGIDDYVIKPCEPQILKMKVDNLVKSRELLKQHYTRPAAPPATAAEYFVDNAVRLIEQHLAAPDFGVRQLAELLLVSPTSLYRKIREVFQVSPNVLIRRMRLKKAGELLKTHSLSVTEVAELIGYNDVSSFRKHFTDHFGKTPLAYAKE